VIKRIGILTGGGDAPGLNAVIRAVVLTAHLEFDCEVTGIRNGFDGLLQPDGLLPLSTTVVDEILPKGGTILGAANRGNPFDRLVVRNGKQVREDVSGAVVDRIKQLALDALIVVGGDGTLGIARDLFKMGVSVIGVPKTIDNDVGGTEASFGFDTALKTRTYYEDIAFIDEMLTGEMVKRLDIFVYDPKEKQKSYDLQAVKEMLISQKLFKGEPYIEVEPGGHQRELILTHREEERKLDPKRVSLFLRTVHSLWRNPVRLRANGKVYTYDRRGFSTT